MKEFFTIMCMIFLLEFADKTQLAAISFATRQNPIMVYLAVVLGLSLATIISVAIGKVIGMALPTKYIKIVAGILFIVVGIWTIISK